VKLINGFQGEYRFLSNFWPCQIVYQDNLYSTVEHAYQSAKVESPDIKKRIRNCSTPADAKDFLEINKVNPDPGWTVEKKMMIMEELLRTKFSGNEPFLTRAILATVEAELVEWNNWNDTFWGVCNNTGENNLGRLLMKIRKELIQQKEQIILQLELNLRNDDIAKVLSITPRQLYEKMMAFKIQNKEYWIS
jgi:ribA/ribD-fused uncharacterized protein